MLSINQNKSKLPVKIKIILIIFGLFLFLILIEAGLHLGGFAFFFIQDYNNRQAIKLKDAYYIMCLGESTTGFGGRNSWPAQLQEILNDRQKEIQFKIINKGMPGGNSSLILSCLEKYINDYNPDMVITMMGINDGRLAIEFEDPVVKKSIPLLQKLKTYKLLRLFWLHIANKNRRGELELKSQNNPADSEIEETLKKAVIISPRNDGAYNSLGNFYIQVNRLPEAESMFKKALEINPNNDDAYLGLGDCNLKQSDYQEAEGMFKKAIAINPRNDGAYNSLGNFYIQVNRLPEAESILKKAIEINPDNRIAYIELGCYYNSKQEYHRAEEILKKVISLFPYESWAYVELEYCYQMQGRGYENAKMYHKYVYNYRKIKETLDQRKIKLVCVQYPRCSIKPLKNIFRLETNIIFVDNEKIFNDALMYAKYEDYFEDRFAGNFGHCTTQGNRILAENIAEQILKEFENKVKH